MVKIVKTEPSKTRFDRKVWSFAKHNPITKKHSVLPNKKQ